MIMMSSYNKRNHPNYRDCVIILCADTFMSVLGGTTVFAILGSMALKMNKPINEIVGSPLTLTFISYTEATSHMPVSTLWALLFFVMMFMIGMSSLLALVEGFATCIVDENPRLANKHWLVVTVICSICFILNVICFTFQNGFHIFSILSKFLSSVSLAGTLLLEIIITMLFYGAPRLFRDIQCMHGLPPSLFARIFGNIGVYIKIGSSFTAPLLAILMSVVICIQVFDMEMTDKIDAIVFTYPHWTVIIGFIIASLPLLLVPIGGLFNYLQFKKRGVPLKSLFQISEDHPAIR
ncbi:hypothetical protein PMAYCL1PPCAC_06058, partial [Pristionchus mayeri]